MRDLVGLIERVEKLTGPDTEVDGAIGDWLWDQGHEPWGCYDYGGNGPYIAFTASLDAAVALVDRMLPDNLIRLSNEFMGFWKAEVGLSKSPGMQTAPLAVLSALLRALQSSGGQK
jgi:hypothetical protein